MPGMPGMPAMEIGGHPMAEKSRDGRRDPSRNDPFDGGLLGCPCVEAPSVPWCVGIRRSTVRGGRRRAMCLEVPLGHPVDEWNEERNHAQAGDKERHEDEQQVCHPFPRESRRQNRRRNGIPDRGRRERQDRQECRSGHTVMVRAGEIRPSKPIRRIPIVLPAARGVQPAESAGNVQRVGLWCRSSSNIPNIPGRPYAFVGSSL
jgi:hypothetical protein